jgi:hypothetical protein
MKPGRSSLQTIAIVGALVSFVAETTVVHTASANVTSKAKLLPAQLEDGRR